MMSEWQIKSNRIYQIKCTGTKWKVKSWPINVQLQICTEPLTVIIRGHTSADRETHVVECTEILCQRVIVLLVKACKCSELGPTELHRSPVSLDSERWHNPVEVGFFAPWPVTASYSSIKISLIIVHATRFKKKPRLFSLTKYHALILTSKQLMDSVSTVKLLLNLEREQEYCYLQYL